MNIPNILTIIRIMLIPLLIITLLIDFKGNNITACFIFLIACLTDFIDGYLARKLNQSSLFGAFLDPVADKLLVTVTLLLLTTKYNHIFVTICTIIITSREIIISALREWMAEQNQRSKIAVSYMGKIKTTFQMISISILLAFSKNHESIIYIGYIFLFCATILTIWSMIIYINAIKIFGQKK